MSTNAGFNERAMATTSGEPPETAAETRERLDREFVAEGLASLGTWLDDKGLDIDDPALHLRMEAVPAAPPESSSYRAPEPRLGRTLSFVSFGFEIDEHTYSASYHGGSDVFVTMFIQPGPGREVGYVQVRTIEDIGAALHEERRRIDAHGSGPLTKYPDYVVFAWTTRSTRS